MIKLKKCFCYSATEIINFDSSQPSTSIQIRLSDGSRLTGRFNLTHTIGDLRLFITTYVTLTNYLFRFD